MKVVPIRNESGLLAPEWRRAGRGLIDAVRQEEQRCAALLPTTWPRRHLVPTIWRKDVRGQCKWCGQPADTPRRMWHNECVVAYKVATGQHDLWRVVETDRTCRICRKNRGTEIDHVLAVGIAARHYRLGLKRRWWRAWWVENLQWLCRDCHVRKTQADRLVMRDLDRGVIRMDFAA